jgi:hypothetical protein
VLTRSPMASSACVPSKPSDCPERSAGASRTAIGATPLTRAERSSESSKSKTQEEGKHCQLVGCGGDAFTLPGPFHNIVVPRQTLAR